MVERQWEGKRRVCAALLGNVMVVIPVNIGFLSPGTQDLFFLLLGDVVKSWW